VEFPKSIVSENLEGEFLESLNYLNSQMALDSLEKDAYWPKWHSPWWHMSLLFEMGLSDWIPDAIVEKVIERMNTQYLRFFPLHEEELEAGVNPYTQIPCHCQLGNIYQILKSKGIDVDERLPWIRPWFLKYQLPDGGLNCDESAYLNSRKSSIASSLPVFEAMLLCAESGGLSAEEAAFLDKAAEYLVCHRLVYRTNGELMNPDFLTPQFPRFYLYDILRGLKFLNRWRDYRWESSPLTQAADQVIRNGVEVVQAKLSNGLLTIERSELGATTTLVLDDSGQWKRGEPAVLFPLLTVLSAVGRPSPYITSAYEEVMASLEKRKHADC
jgi:hypothetical protein